MLVPTSKTMSSRRAFGARDRTKAGLAQKVAGVAHPFTTAGSFRTTLDPSRAEPLFRMTLG
jgi:hypothetical protein